MAGYKDYREPRRRGFDDDRSSNAFGRRDREPAFPSRRPDAAPASPPMDATVMWFNASKGFGFVELEDGGQAFLHIRALESAGHSDVPPGARMRVTVQDAQKGKQVAQVVEVSGEVAAVPSGGRQSAPPRRPQQNQFQSDGPEEQGEGTVKWYNSEKGFGFIALDGGGKDVFIHANALSRSGLTGLADGQRVDVTYSQRQKGPEAKSIRVI